MRRHAAFLSWVLCLLLSGCGGMYSAKYVNKDSPQALGSWEVDTLPKGGKGTDESAVQSFSLLAESGPDESLPEIVVDAPRVGRGLKATESGASVRVIGRANARSGVTAVFVNGRKASLDASGRFFADVPLKVGDNRIAVTAHAGNRQARTESFVIARVDGASVQPGKAALFDIDEPFAKSDFDKGRYHVLAIGINAYRHIGKLKTAVNDARTVATVLKENYGFETSLITDHEATRENIMNQLNQLRAKLTFDDKLLVYYAGHGVHDRQTDASYWLPVDAKMDNDTNWIDAKSITDQLKRITARHVLVIADSCYSGTMDRAVDPSLSGSDTRDRFLRKLYSKKARVLIASGGDEPVSDFGGQGHSVFAQVLLDSLKSADKEIFTAEELFVRQIKESVAGRAAQTPEYRLIRNSGHEGGDFVFYKRR